MSEDELRAAAFEGLRLHQERYRAERARMSRWSIVAELWSDAPWMGRLAFFGVMPVAALAFLGALVTLVVIS
jgi:hypothetical protein